MTFLQNGQSSEKTGLLGPRGNYVEYHSGLGKEIDVDTATSVSTNGCLPSCVLSAHNISYTVQVPADCCRRKEAKQILHNITGVFRQGMTAILGPTGSGKSTLLDVLADRKDPRGVEGQRLLDAKPIPDNFKCMVGYVVQGDILMGKLSVRENLTFSAALRLPTTMSHSDKQQRVNQVIRELGLENCADSKVGTPFIRGVSGGERKRCSIGMELIISPTILLLDEPTTGLDANTAYNVVSILQRMARGGRTIILAIHQPRYSIYRLFDNIMLLAGGSTVYAGPAQEAMQFFAELGYQCQAYNNPPDFFLDVINGINLGKRRFAPGSYGSKRTNQDLIFRFRGSTWNSKLETEADSILSKYICQGKQPGERHPTVEYATSWGHQMLVVSMMALMSVVRNPGASIIATGKSLLTGILVSLFFWQLSENPTTAFRNRFGAMFYISMQMIFANVGALDIFVKERKMFLHQSISGYYRVSVFFLSKVLLDAVQLRVVPALITCLCTYFCLGLRAGFDHFCLFVFCMSSLTMAGSSLSLLIGAFFTNFFVSLLLSQAITSIMTLVAGFFIHTDSLVGIITWFQYVSVVRYAMKALSINEFKDRQFCAWNSTCVDGNTFLENSNIAYETPWDFWSNYLFIIGFAVLMLVLTYIRLRCMKKFT